MANLFEQYCEITEREFLGSGYDTYIFKDKQGIRYHVSYEMIQEVCKKSAVIDENRHYVIQHDNQFVKDVSFHVIKEFETETFIEGDLVVEDIQYTNHLQFARIFSNGEILAYLDVWKKFFNGEVNVGFKLHEIEVRLKYS